MTAYATQANDDDLHLLMAVAVLCGQRNVRGDTLPIFQAWADAYPRDALGPIGLGLAMMAKGHAREGYRLIDDAAERAETRADQARDVRDSIRESATNLAAG